MAPLAILGDLLAVVALDRVRAAALRVGSVMKLRQDDLTFARSLPAVFYTLTCSSGEDMPRGLDFPLQRQAAQRGGVARRVRGRAGA